LQGFLGHGPSNGNQLKHTAKDRLEKEQNQRRHVHLDIQSKTSANMKARKPTLHLDPLIIPNHMGVSLNGGTPQNTSK